mgnify:FL=1
MYNSIIVLREISALFLCLDRPYFVNKYEGVVILKFEVYNSENKIMEWTEDFECIKDSYQKGHLAEMRKQKWKFKLDGKLISYPQIEYMILINICKKDYKPAPKKKVRKILCKNNNTTYNNMSECAKDLGFDPAAISYVMKKGTNEYKGYKFEFVE